MGLLIHKNLLVSPTRSSTHDAWQPLVIKEQFDVTVQSCADARRICWSICDTLENMTSTPSIHKVLRGIIDEVLGKEVTFEELICMA